MHEDLLASSHVVSPFLFFHLFFHRVFPNSTRSHTVVIRLLHLFIWNVFTLYIYWHLILTAMLIEGTSK